MAPHTDEEFLAWARAHYQTDGEVEFDDDATIYQVEGGYGAYVQAFVWVEFPDTPEVTPVSVAPQCPSRGSPLVHRTCQCDHADGHDGSHICAQHALHWTDA